jgi:hypothetical protein
MIEFVEAIGVWPPFCLVLGAALVLSAIAFKDRLDALRKRPTSFGGPSSLHGHRAGSSVAGEPPTPLHVDTTSGGPAGLPFTLPTRDADSLLEGVHRMFRSKKDRRD